LKKKQFYGKIDGIMTDISIDLVKELRNKTGVSIMQCKKALIEADGDLEKAKIALTKKSGEIAAKKGDRELGAGVVVVKNVDGKTIILEFACETDFVANNAEFKEVAEKVAEAVVREEETETLQAEATQKFGERTEVVRSEIFESSNLGSYVHNGVIGAVVEFNNEVDEAFGKDIAMHIAAQNPKYLAETDIAEEERVKAEETLREEVADKPAEMQEKILEGKMKSFFKERVLMTQGFIKDPSKTIADLLNEKGVEIVRFVRFGVGEE
jgi:elongation factor Ts